jgi:uncharacterized membrane protein (DUF2068 family)
LLIATNLIVALVGFLMFALLMGAASLVRDPEAVMILPLVAVSIPTLMVALAIPGLIAGFGLLARKAWGRILAIVAAVLGLAGFPVGTLIGIYVLFVLMQDAATTYFASPPSRMQTAPRPA